VRQKLEKTPKNLQTCASEAEIARTNLSYKTCRRSEGTQKCKVARRINETHTRARANAIYQNIRVNSALLAQSSMKSLPLLRALSYQTRYRCQLKFPGATLAKRKPPRTTASALTLHSGETRDCPISREDPPDFSAGITRDRA